MKKKLVLLPLLFIYAFSNAQTWDWVKAEPNGQASSESDAASRVKTDASGNVYVLGSFAGTLYLNNNYITTGAGSYLAKYNPAGALLWYQLITPDYQAMSGHTYGGDVSIRATDLVVNGSGVFITGGYNISRGGIALDCSVTQDGKPYRIGSYNFISSLFDIGFFLSKFSADGNIVWNKTATHVYQPPNGCAGPEGCANCDTKTIYYPILTSDPSNNITVAFMYSDYYYQAGFMLDGVSIPSSKSPNTVGSVLNIISLNSDGVYRWSNNAVDYPNYGGDDAVSSIIADNNGNIFLMGQAGDGTFFGSYSISGTSQSRYIAKISSTGTWQFVKKLTAYTTVPYLDVLAYNANAAPNLLAVDASNNVYALVNLASAIPSPQYILGIEVPVPASSSAMYFLKMTNDGNPTWVKKFGYTPFNGSQYGVGIQYANNDLYITGAITSGAFGTNYQFGNLVVPSAQPTGWEYLVARANVDGDFKWATTFSGYFVAGFSIAVSGDNIYTCGAYRKQIYSLGNFNVDRSATTDWGTNEIFFGKLKDQYVKVGALSAVQLTPGCSVTIPFTSTGLTFSATNKFTAELSNASGDFSSPTAIGSVTSTGTGSIKAAIPGDLPLSTSGYRVKIKSSDLLKTGYPYYAYADIQYSLSITCPSTPTDLTTTNISDTSATLNWATVPCAPGYKTHYRKKGTSSWTIVSVNSNKGALSIKGLTNATTYEWQVATKCTSGGTTSYSAYSSIKEFTSLPGGVLEAEEAVLNGAVIASNQPGYTGTGFADYAHASGDYIEWTVNASAAGSFTLQFRYANGGATDRPLKLEVNGAVVNASQSFIPTGNFATWSVSSATVSLIAGINKVRLTTIGSNGPNIDHLAVILNTTTLEAEEAVLNGAVIASNQPGYAGTGFADYVHASEDYIEWTVNAPAAGSYSLQFRYANGGTTDRPLKLEVNGVVVNASLSFIPTGNFATWSVSSATASLIAGTNKVRLTTIGSNGPNVDNLKVDITSCQLGTLEAEQAVLNGAIIASNQPGYTGTGFADYVHATGDYIEWTVNALTTGSFTLQFRYANGGATDRPLKLEVNGAVVNASLSFIPTGNFATWSVSSATVSLIAGANKIRLTTIGSNGPNIDNLAFSCSNSSQSLQKSAVAINTSLQLSNILTVYAAPNPSMSNFKLTISSNNKIDKISFLVTDVLGKVIESKNNINLYDKIEIGNFYQPGIYFVKIKQEGRYREVKLIKGVNH